MNEQLKEFRNALREALKKGNILWKQHSLERLFERGISRKEVLETIKSGDIIEFYPTDYPLPSCLILKFDRDLPLHVVVAVDMGQKDLYIITAYRPSIDAFLNDYKTRRQK